MDESGNESGRSGAASVVTPEPAGFTKVTWSNANADQPYGNSEAQGEVVGGKLYVFGGFDSTKGCCTPTDRAYVFSPANNSWTPINDLKYTYGNGGVTHAGFTTDGTDLYMAGGYTQKADGAGQRFGSKEVWKYGVSSDGYTRLPDLPVERSAGQLEYLNGKLHYFGGTNLSRTQDTGEHYVLDLSNQSAGWSELAPLPNPRNHLAAATLDGKIYAIGGQKGHDGSLVSQDDVHAYDPATDQWTEVASLPPAGEGRNHVTSSTFTMGGRILVAGGQVNHNTSLNSATAYDPKADAWVELTPLPVKRHSGVAGAINGNIYFTTGGNSKTTFLGVPENSSPPSPDTEAPKITSTSPADGAESVALGTNATATFSEKMDASTINNFTFYLIGEGAKVPASVSYDAATNKATLNPDADLKASTPYTVTIARGVKDAAGNGMSEDAGWSFTTRGADPAPEPAAGWWPGSTPVDPR